MIKIAVFNDVIAWSGQTSREEAEDIVAFFNENIGESKLVHHSNRFSPSDVPRSTDVVVIDYGGIMLGAYDHVKDTTRLALEWAEDHPSNPLVIWSSFQGRLYKDEFEQAFAGRDENVFFRYGKERQNPSWAENQKQTESIIRDMKLWLLGEAYHPEASQPPQPEPQPAPVASPVEPPATQAKAPKKPAKRKRLKITDFPVFDLGSVKAYDTSGVPDKNGERRGLVSFVSFATDVSDGDDNQIGMIGGGPGVVVISIGDYYLQILHEDLWNAAAHALGLDCDTGLPLKPTEA